MAAFWWVEETSDKKAANMIEDVIEKNGIKIPVLKNNVPIEPHTKLCKYKPAAAKKNIAAVMDGTPAPSKPAKRTKSA